MNGKRFFCFSFFAIHLFIIVPPVFASSTVKIRSRGETLLNVSGDKGKLKIHISIKQGEVHGAWAYGNVSMWGGEDKKLPKYSISNIELKVNGKIVYLPLSSYVDLGNVYSASIDNFNGGFDIELYGGDTSSSYIAILRFRGSSLMNRSVILKEFPEQNWEITNYSYTEVSN